MKRKICMTLAFWLTAPCLAQTVCPRHVETPIYYPPLARAARVQGKVNLRVTIDADGNVTNAVVANDHSVSQVLQEAAIDNIRQWTFEKPASAPVTQLIVYEFKFDSSLPVSRQNYPITKMSIDLPDHVTILSNEMTVNPGQQEKKQKSGAP